MAASVTNHSPATVLDAEHVAFMSRDAISSAIATRDGSNRPSITKGLAVRVQGERGVVEIFVDQERSAAVLHDVRAGSPVAIVCSEPSSHRTIQVKGPRADIEPLAPGDEQFVAAKVDALVDHIVRLNYTHQVVQNYLTFAPSAVIKVVFAASAAFLQTPGPGAGAPLKK